MIRRGWVSVMVLVAMAHVEVASAGVLRLTMDEAVARAQSANADLRANRKDVDVAEANLEKSKVLLPGNPLVAGGLQRTAETSFGPNYGVSLSQEFEVGGQRRRRMAVAQQGLEKATWDVKTGDINLAASVKVAFIQALIA